MSAAAPVRRIAIIGMGCRFPGGADTPERYWQLLHDGVDAIDDIPASRWNNGQFFDPDVAVPGKLNVTRGGFLDDVAGFDADFFGMSPREAVHIDPQQRLLLEMAYEAFEDAGLALEAVAGTSTGVFVGISTHDYGDIQMYPGNRNLIDARSNVGVATSLAANRISYAYDLRGPSLIVDTACSSSLTAAHLAIASLRRGECSIALVGGVQLMLTPEVTIGFSKATMLSPDGRCAAFDAAANGYARSEGGAVLVLKPFDAAVADGDRIYAVLEGSAINQDGHTTGMTVPSAEAQAAMLRAALVDAQVSAADIDYVEAHGTGTPVGDPLEAEAIGSVFGPASAAAGGTGRRLAIGSVKTNVGHLEAAAGMAGLCKTALSLYHRQVPPSLHFHTPNPAIDFDQLRLRVVTELEAWPVTPAGRPGRAGVNSFGFGGANAHVVVGGAQRPVDTAPVAGPAAGPRVLPVSARSAEALTANLSAFAESVAQLPAGSTGDFAAFCRTASMRRSQHEHRVAAVAETPDELAELLGALAAGERRAAGAAGRARPADARVAFVFAGMGPQWWAMGRSLLEHDADYQAIVARCEAALSGLTPWSLTEELLRAEADSRVTEPDLAQVTNFAVQAGLTAVFARLGIRPDAVIGHSAGEMAAACAAGVLSIEAGAVLAWHRGRLQGRTAGSGRMLAVGLPAAEVSALLVQFEGRVGLAAVNDPSSATLSGDEDALTEIEQQLKERQQFARFLSVDVPYHSAHMDAIEAELRESLTFLEPGSPSVPMMSVVDADWVTPGRLDGEYWWRNVRQPVRFADGINHLLDDGFTTFLEVSPHPVLVTSVNGCLAGRGQAGGAAIGSLRRNEDDVTSVLRATAALWTRGVSVDWAAVHGAGPDRSVLPTYAWNRDRHWFESAPTLAEPTARAPWVHPLLGWRLPAAVPHWQAELAEKELGWLDDHVLRTTVVYPGAAYVEAILAAARSLGADQPAARSITLKRALVLAPRADVLVQCALGERGVTVLAGSAGHTDADWEEHATARLDLAGAAPAPIDRVAAQAECPRSEAVEAVYAAFAQRGLNYGPSFTGIAEAMVGDGRVLARLVLPSAAGSTDGYLVHPALLDAAFQLLVVAAGDSDDALFVPVQIDRVVAYQPVGRTCWASARIVSSTAREVVGEVDLFDADGTVLITVRGLRCRALDDRPPVQESADDWLYELRWEAPPDGSGGPSILAPAAGALASVQASAAALAVEQTWSSYYTEVEPALQGAAAGYVWQLLLDAGWDPQRVCPRDQLIALLAPAADRVRQAQALLHGLVGAGWLAERDGGLVARGEAPEPADAGLDLLAATQPRFGTDVALVRRAGAALGPVLRGDVGGAEVLLGAEGAQLLQHFYRDAPASLFTNTLIGRAAATVIAGRADARPLRVLEVGGGTGGTTEFLRAALPADTRYVFTDISPAFTQAMAQSAPEIETRVFDLERPLEQQGLAGGYDIVVAANVVHATADLAESLGRLRELLAPGGRLLLVEITRPLLWLDVVFGASPGWWAYADDHRSSGALLDPAAWLTVLAEAGFVDAAIVADEPLDGPPGQCVLVAARPLESELIAREPAGRWTVSGDGALAERVRDRLAQRHVLAAGDDATGLIHIAERAGPSEDLGAGGLLDFVDEVRAGLRERAPLADGTWVITAGAQAVGISRPVPELAALWGLVRVARKEYPERTWRLVDLSADPTDDEVDSLLGLLFGSSADGEDEIAVRGDRRFVRRLRRITTPVVARPAQAEEGWRADVARPGALDTIAPRPVPRRSPERGEVEIRIDAASCNFRDVMIASGLLPPIASEGTFADRLLGLDLAGTVVGCGPGVDDVRVGDRVFGIGPGTFASYTTTTAALITSVPAGLDAASAAAIPCAFVTAVYALEHIARLQPGERVLIHAATGGVGLAALQVARALGAEIYATAGSEAKRARLRELGVEHIFDSRSLDFADGVLAATNGAGVDVVLNSLSGPAIAAGLRCLARYGRFVEIGKRDIYDDAPLALLPFRRNLSFSAVDLDLLCRERPELAGSMLRVVAERFAEGSYQPLPIVTFPVQQTDAALRLLGQARHIGKVVIDVSSAPVLLAAPAPTPRRCRADSSYLVTGGTGGFGRAVAGWLADQGAGAIVLLSRSGLDEATLVELQQRCAPVPVSVGTGDVGDEADLRRVLDGIRAEQPPLRGVVHAAMTLADGPLTELTMDQLAEGLHAKAGGVRLLDELTSTDDLDLFVVFSSISSLLGNPSQGAYAAANAAMAAVVHDRRAGGRAGTVIDWGVLGDVGYVAQNPEVAAFLKRQGYLPFTAGQALSALDAVLADGRPQVMAARIDWPHWALTATREATLPRLAHLVPASIAAGSAGSTGFISARELSPEEQRAAVLDRVRATVARLLGIAPARVDPDRSLFDLGFDSLIAVELTVNIRTDFGVELAVLQLLKDMTIGGLAELIVTQLPARPEQLLPAPAVAPAVVEVDAGEPIATAPDVQAAATPPSAAVVRYSALDYTQWTRAQRRVQRTAIGIAKLLATLDVQGAEHLATPGPYVLATNHLTLLDVPLVLAIMPRPAVIFAAPELRRYPWIDWVLADLGNAIYVDRGAGDTEAIEQGLAVLHAGGVLGLSPEGVRSPQLTRAKTGAARLAAGAEAPVVPLAIWGQDGLGRQWRRGRRAQVHIRVGAPIPAPGPSTAEVVAFTSEIMTRIAAMLPARYRGEYADEAGEALSRTVSGSPA